MFSFVGRAKPGKHFLIETDDEDGQLEDSAPPAKFRSAKENDYAVYRKEEKCEIGKEWKEFDGERFCKKAPQYLIIPS